MLLMTGTKTEIYWYLKKNGKSTLEQIVTGIQGTYGEVVDILDSEVARGYIRKDTTSGPFQYSVRIKLGRLVSKDEIAPLWRHKEIIQRAAPQKVSIISQKTIKTLLDALFWWQGGRPSCVGFGGSLYKWRLYIEATGDIPTIEEIKAAGQIIEEDIGCTAGKFKYITQPRTFWSMQWLYDRSRKFGGASFPAGSDTTWCAKVIALEGAVPADACITSITGLCAPELYPMVEGSYDKTLAKLAPIAAQHKNKFAASNDFNEVFNAIKAGRAVFGPVNLPPDYLNPPGGRWRSYGGGSAGGHAVAAMLVDEIERLLVTRGSWDGDGGEKWYSFDERFFDENAGPFLIGLTQDEAKIGEALYKSLSVDCNVPAQITVDNITIGMTPVKTQLEIGKKYEIGASCEGYIPQSQTVIASADTQPLYFEISKIPVPEKTWIQRFFEWLISLWRK